MTQRIQMIGREGTEIRDSRGSAALPCCLSYDQSCKHCGPFRFNTALQTTCMFTDRRSFNKKRNNLISRYKLLLKSMQNNSIFLRVALCH